MAQRKILKDTLLKLDIRKETLLQKINGSELNYEVNAIFTNLFFGFTGGINAGLPYLRSFRKNELAPRLYN